MHCTRSEAGTLTGANVAAASTAGAAPEAIPGATSGTVSGRLEAASAEVATGDL